MPAHWTYQEIFDCESDLEQGDILYPSEGLLALFSKVHPHFCQDKYLGFLVASQSCDLVRRKGGSPKAGYVSLSAIRPLSQVMPKLVAQVVTPFASARFPLSGKDEAKRLLERILNQNEQSIGLFFLFQEEEMRLGEPAVAMLRVTLALKSEHYKELVQARVGRLKPEFQSKLGWLLGNLYNRPATPDWADQDGGKAEFDQLIRNYVGDSTGNGMSLGIMWVDDALVELAKVNNLPLGEVTRESFESLRPEPPIERALDEILDQLAKVDPDIDADKLTKLRNRLKNNGKFSKFFPRR